MRQTTPKLAQVPKSPAAPASLDEAGKRFWNETLAVYDLADPHHLRLLENCCLQLDRAAVARDTIATEGITCENRFGEVREHPAVHIERAAAQLFRQTVRELGLDLEDAPIAPRGPRRPGSRQG